MGESSEPGRCPAMPRIFSRDLLVIAAAAVMALASLITSAVLSDRLQSRILEVQETTALRRQLFILSDALRKAEAAQRFYIITGDAAHGAPVDALESALPERWAAIRESAGPEQQAGIQELVSGLEISTAEAVASLRRAMSVRDQRGRDAAIEVVESGATHARLAAVYEKLNAVMEQLEEQLQEESRRMMRAERRGHSAAVAAGIVAMLLTALGIWQWRQTLRHRQREMELASEKARAEQTVRDKGDFLAAMSHEVRTPLNAMLGLSEALRDSLPAGVQREQAGAVHNAGRSLLRLVNDLLDLSRMDAGRLQLVTEPVTLSDFIAGLRPLLAQQAEAASVSLHISADPALPAVIMADGGRLRQVALNLAGNALKFTAAGGEVRIRLESERSAEGQMLVLEVKDNGCGIPPALQEAVFQAYVQGDRQPPGDGSGAGLGLAIVRQLVRLMGGTVRLQSQPGQGTTFRVTLPLAVLAEQDACAAQHPVPATPREHSDAAEAPPLPEPLSPRGRSTLVQVMEALWPAAAATLSSADIRSLAEALAVLGAAEGCPLLEQTAARLQSASSVFSVTALNAELRQLPLTLSPLLPNP